jgi:chromosomal replication initiator protein
MHEPVIRGIPELVAKHFGITPNALLSRKQDRKLARPRQVAMWLACRVTLATMAEVARYFERDHKTVAHAVQRINALITSDAAFYAVVVNLAHLVDKDEASDMRRTMIRRAA